MHLPEPLWPDFYLWNILKGDLQQIDKHPIWQGDLIKEKKAQDADKNLYDAIIKKAADGYKEKKGITARSKITQLAIKPKRMLKAAMEPYFNQAFEAFWLQTNGEEKMPTVTELAALYYGVDEITAASYLLGTANGGTNCNLDK